MSARAWRRTSAAAPVHVQAAGRRTAVPARRRCRCTVASMPVDALAVEQRATARHMRQVGDRGQLRAAGGHAVELHPLRAGTSARRWSSSSSPRWWSPRLGAPIDHRVVAQQIQAVHVLAVLARPVLQRHREHQPGVLAVVDIPRLAAQPGHQSSAAGGTPSGGSHSWRGGPTPAACNESITVSTSVSGSSPGAAAPAGRAACAGAGS